MYRKQASQSSPQTNLFRPFLLDFINTKNELVILSQQVNWSRIEGELSQYYTKLVHLPRRFASWPDCLF